MQRELLVLPARKHCSPSCEGERYVITSVVAGMYRWAGYTASVFFLPGGCLPASLRIRTAVRTKKIFA